MDIFKTSCKQGMNIRRLRLRSIVRTSPWLLTDILPWITHLHYELVTNLCIWILCNGADHFFSLKRLGYFNDNETFFEQGRELGVRVKGLPHNPELKRLYSELSNLSGYKLDVSDFDVRAESEKLAQGGNPETDYANQIFQEELINVIPSAVSIPKTRLSFEEYVKEGAWLTVGSSSIGSVEWTFDQEHGKFKARKNQLLYLYGPDELWAMIRDWDGVIRNKPIIKNELSKCRLAVASNIESYIHEAYMLDMLGHKYINWDYITLDESETDYCIRTKAAQELLNKGCYALPWDFASFDHQPTTHEIKSIIHRSMSTVIMNESQRNVVIKIMQSYDKATLYDTNPQHQFSFPITGGLQTGQRITSFIGNIWNAVKTRGAIRVAKTLCPTVDPSVVAVRGDDTYIVTNTAVEAYYIRLGYASLNAEGNDRKMSIRQHSLEFLRSEVAADHVTAWPNRAIPAVTQRKPWNDAPWDPTREVTIMADNFRNVERRLGFEVPKVHEAVRIQWSQFTRQSTRYLDLPKRLGGLGIYPFRGWLTSACLPSSEVTKPRITTDLKGEVPDFLQPYVSREDYVQGSMATTIAPGDVSSCLNKMTDGNVTRVRALRPVWRKINYSKPNLIPSFPVEITGLVPASPGYQFPKKKPLVKMESVTHGWPRFERLLSEYGKIKSKMKHSLASLIKQHYPDVYQWMRILEARGFHRTDAIDIILGDCPMEMNRYTNPRLGSICKSLMARLLPVTKRSRDTLAFMIYALTENICEFVSSSPLAQLYTF